MKNLENIAQQIVQKEKTEKAKEIKEFKNEYVYKAIREKLVDLFGKDVLETIIDEDFQRIKTRVNDSITAEFSLSLSACNFASALSGHKYSVDTKEEADSAFLQYTYKCSLCDFWNVFASSVSSAGEFYGRISRVQREGCDLKLTPRGISIIQSIHGYELSSERRSYRNDISKYWEGVDKIDGVIDTEDEFVKYLKVQKD